MKKSTKDPMFPPLEPVGSRRNAFFAHVLAARLRKFFDTPTSLTYLAQLLAWPYGEEALQDAISALWVQTAEHERLAARLAAFDAIEREIQAESYIPVTQRLTHP